MVISCHSSANAHISPHLCHYDNQFGSRIAFKVNAYLRIRDVILGYLTRTCRVTNLWNNYEIQGNGKTENMAKL